ncbi:hypothetical protein LSH36_892g00000 [Paralvinella palmiformis]|uniref:Uncharacterized protein n=1 Tax=Paralvinella palmiformis TaxID=53620 RepID=A0AAD9IYJ2_9ANNE|nr:hypothetical protein LSH36_892g00000 [Paralvinella palmiformis]
MSQESFLDDVTQWSPEECLQKIDDALPKIIVSFKLNEDYLVLFEKALSWMLGRFSLALVTQQRILNSDGTDVSAALKIMCRYFLPICQLQQLECKIFSKVKDKILNTSTKLFNDVSEIVKNTVLSVDQMTVQISNVLQNYQEILDIVDEFVNSAKAAGDVVRLEQVHSLPSLVLQILSHSYSHCKLFVTFQDSSQIYGDLLPAVTEPLSALFKKAYAIQLKLVITSDSLDTVLRFIQTGLSFDTLRANKSVKIQFTLRLTGYTHPSLFKFKITDCSYSSNQTEQHASSQPQHMVKLMCQYKDGLLNQLEVDKMLSSLAEDMESSLNYHIQIINNSNQSDEKTFTKTIKVLGFQMKVLVAIVKEYECVLADCIADIISLMLNIQSTLPPSLKNRAMSDQHQTEIYKHLGVALEPLISYLIPNINFIVALTKVMKDDDISHWAAFGMILVLIIKLLPNYSDDTQTAWINPKLYPEDDFRNPILKAIFNTVPHCYVELCLPASLPTVMSKGQPQRNISLYHHLCTHLCVFVASLPAKHFPVLEDCLVENILSSNVHNTLLATDVWCFVVRYGSAELCLDHCLVLARLLQKMGSQESLQCCHLVNMLKRLTKFLAPEHVECFISQFPVDSNFLVYSAVVFSAFSNEQLQKLAGHLLASCITAVDSWIESPTHKVSDARKLTGVYRVLCNLYSSRPVQDPDNRQHQTLIEHSIKCLLSLPCTVRIQHQYVQLLAAGVLEFLAYNIEQLDNTASYQIMSEVIDWLKCDNVEAVVRVTVAYFLCGLGKKYFPPDTVQIPILRILPRLFNILLADSDPLVQQVSLESFSQFAEETSHETIVRESLQCDDQIQIRVVSYLSLLSNDQSSNSINYSLLKLYQDILDWTDRLTSEDLPPTSSPSDQPPNKKCKLDSPENEVLIFYGSVNQSEHDGIAAHGASNLQPFGYKSYALTNCTIIVYPVNAAFDILDRQIQEALQLLENGTEQLWTALSKNGQLPHTYINKISGIQSRLIEILSKT